MPRALEKQPSHFLPRQSVHTVLERSELKSIFQTLDLNGDGHVSQIEFIKGLRNHPHIAARLGLPPRILQESRSRDVLQLTFNEIDANNNKTIEFEEFEIYYCPPVAAPAEESFDIPEAPVTPYQPAGTAHRTASPPVAIPPGKARVDQQFDSVKSFATFATLESEDNEPTAKQMALLGSSGPEGFESFKTVEGGYPAFQDFVAQGYNDISPKKKQSVEAGTVVRSVSLKTDDDGWKVTRPVLVDSEERPLPVSTHRAPEHQQHFTPPFSQPVPIEPMHFDIPGYPGHLDPSAVEAEKGSSQLATPQVDLPALRKGVPWRPSASRENKFGVPHFERTDSQERIAKAEKESRKSKTDHLHQRGFKTKDETVSSFHPLLDSWMRPNTAHSHIVAEQRSEDGFMRSFEKGFTELFTCSNPRWEDEKKAESVFQQSMKERNQHIAFARC